MDASVVRAQRKLCFECWQEDGIDNNSNDGNGSSADREQITNGNDRNHEDGIENISNDENRLIADHEQITYKNNPNHEDQGYETLSFQNGSTDDSISVDIKGTRQTIENDLFCEESGTENPKADCTPHEKGSYFKDQRSLFQSNTIDKSGTKSTVFKNGTVSFNNYNSNGNGILLKAPTVDQYVKHKKGVLKEVGKLYSDDESEWIKYRWIDGADLVCSLPYSGRFHNGMVMMKLHGEGCLLTSSNKYIATVKIDKIDELDGATTFEQAKDILERNMQVETPFRDVDFENAENAKKVFENYMDELSTNSFTNKQHAGDLFQISMSLQKFKHDKKKLFDQINQNDNISSQFKKIINKYVKFIANIEQQKWILKIRNYLFKQADWIDILEETLKKAIATHTLKALEASPVMLREKLEKILDCNVFFVTSTDVKLLLDMENTLDKKMIETNLSALVEKYCEAVANIQPNESTKVAPITNPIYFYLCKSLTDIVKEINTRTSVELEAWYNGKWKHSSPIRWTSSKPSLMDRCIERELKMLIRMLDHFALGKPSAQQNFNYAFEIFTEISNSNHHDSLPTEIHVWLCLLDDTIEHVFDKNQNIDLLCTCLLGLYKSYSESESSTMDSMESIRVITHNTIKYLALAAPFYNSKLDLDREITLSQINTMQRATSGGQMSSFLDYRDLVEVFAQYWKQRSEFTKGISIKLPGEYFNKHLVYIQNILLQCMREALRKNVELAELISFCRAYDELLVDLLDLSFEWFVRIEKGEINDIIMKRVLIELVKNKWQDSEHKCYRVTNVSKFSGVYLGLSAEDDEFPKHYILETVRNLLDSIYNMLMKIQWNDGAQLTEVEQISSASLMIASVRSCLIYLKEQPDYIDFDKFLEENSKPFASLSAKCSSFEEFKERVTFIKESFWYIRNLNAIDIETALNLFKLNNDNNYNHYNENYLRQAYKKYSEQFDIYMATNDGSEENIWQVAAEVQSTVVNKLTPEWDFEFKQNVLPRLLAGMGAVWALHTSKDVAITGHFLKPHCIQVLGVLRLLSADNDRQGVMKHLAQILTGQGKSLVLGMTATVLALCGHTVTIMCYSDYLATRDQQDFQDFYDYFSVNSEIEYKTFDKAAYDEFNRYSSNAKAHVYKCLGIPSSSETNRVKCLKNPVLLIDEVDVFFNENLFGKVSIQCTMLRIPGLAEVQMEIWRLVTDKVQNIRQSIDAYITNNSCKAIANFKTCINKQNLFKILETHGDTINEQEYSNSTLFSNHINEMIKTAERVCKVKVDDKFFSDFRINEKGNICYKTAFGIYSEFVIYNYYNTFIYFRLKKTDFVPENYGYLMLDLGCTSFAKLPESYPLILGVTGTLTTIGQYEKKVVKEYYQITESSVMPSFFGTSNLQFDETLNVNCYQTSMDWTNAIFNRINMIVNDHRAVLVIFDTDESINNFKQQYVGQLNRLNVLTINTSSNEKQRLINESGVSTTITLATREMGRGVDYKSSVTVEKNGGVHVIQTFFSLDIKEETQIKGRTARKDNRGSYEMILCYEDLKSLKLVLDDFEVGITYQKLSDARDQFTVANDVTRDDSVQKSNEMHEKTIEFYGKL